MVDELPDALDFSYPERVLGTLGHDQDTVFQIFIGDNFGVAVEQHQIQFFGFVTSFAGAVEL